MNYIHKLQAEVRSLKDQVVALEDGIHHLRDYASSDKFMGEAGYGGPTYINKLDVIHRCNDALENRFHAEAPAWFKDGASSNGTEPWLDSRAATRRSGAYTTRLPDRC